MTAALILIAEAVIGKLAPLGASSLIELLVTGGFKLVTLLLTLKSQNQQGSKNMNSLFKAVLKEAADLVATGEAVAKKSGFVTLLPLLIGDAQDAPAIVSNWSDLATEATALIANPAADADLLAYATTLMGGSGTKATQIITAAATLVLSTVTNVTALVTAIKS